jgi:hypothetical protein
MTTTLTVSRGAVTPASVASDLFMKVKDIEDAIREAEHRVAEVEGRNIVTRIFSSATTDLVNISKSQHRINDLMLAMINEIITLNVMSYGFLADVLDQFSKQVAEGMRESSGQIIKLSSVGKSFADSAASIFNKIIEGSRATRDTIELSAANIESLRAALKEMAMLDERQSRDIASLQHSIEEKDILDDKQSLAIADLQSVVEGVPGRVGRLEIDIQEKSGIDSLQSQQIASFQLALDQQLRRVDALERELATLRHAHGANCVGQESLASRVAVTEMLVRGSRKVSVGALITTAFVLLMLAVRQFGFA